MKLAANIHLVSWLRFSGGYLSASPYTSDGALATLSQNWWKRFFGAFGSHGIDLWNYFPI
jgi:hypothetical protein